MNEQTIKQRMTAAEQQVAYIRGVLERLESAIREQGSDLQKFADLATDNHNEINYLKNLVDPETLLRIFGRSL